MQEYSMRHLDIYQDERGWHLGSISAILSGTDFSDNTLRLQFEMPYYGLGVGPAQFSWLMSGGVYTYPEAFIQEIKHNAGVVQVQALVYLDKQHRPSAIMHPEGMIALHEHQAEMDAKRQAKRDQAIAASEMAVLSKITPEDLERLRNVGLQPNPHNLDYVQPYEDIPGKPIQRAESVFMPVEGYKPEPQHLLQEPPVGLSELINGELRRKLEEYAAKKELEERQFKMALARGLDAREIWPTMPEPPIQGNDPEDPPKPIDPTFEE